MRALKKEKLVRLCLNDFGAFFAEIFSKSFDYFVVGDYLYEVADFMQANKKTIQVGPRDHIKTTRFQAYFLWHLLRMRYGEPPKECLLYSYIPKMATYHIGNPRNQDNIKNIIARNPFFNGIVDIKNKAESIGIFHWPEDPTRYCSITASGILSSSRGTHTKGIVFIDDALKDEDPKRKLDAVTVQMINYRIKANIASIPQYDQGAEIHAVGTPQTDKDFYFDPEFTSDKATRYDKAIINEAEQRVLFPELRPFEWLTGKRGEIGSKLFNQEYQGVPAHSLDTFILVDKLMASVDEDLINYADKGAPERLLYADVIVGGYDIGKKVHPSHIAIYLVRTTMDEKPEWIQLVSKWMDGWQYGEQIDYIRRLHERIPINALWYDGTRGELESLEERKLLPGWMKPVNLTGQKQRYNLARAMAMRIEDDCNIRLVNDQRQAKQILAVDRDLHAIQTDEGHGDSFWSNALAQMYDIENVFSDKFQSEDEVESTITSGVIDKDF